MMRAAGLPAAGERVELLNPLFSAGLAYILKLLDQYAQFDALHWFQSLRKKYGADVRAQQQPTVDPKTRRGTNVAEEEKLQQTKALALKRINIYQRVCCSRIAIFD